jgi:hypothetical protein
MADGSRHALHIGPEATYGAGLNGTVLSTVRHTGCTIGLSKSGLESAELRQDRQITDYRHGAWQIGGDISTELSYGSYDDLLEAVFLGTWTADTLKAGITRRSFLLERLFSDILPANKPYHRFLGLEMNTLKLQITAEEMITAVFGAVGKETVLDIAALVGVTVDPPTTTPPMDAFTGVLLEGGTSLACITELSIDLNNSLEPRYCVGSNKTNLPSIGRSNVTGQVTAYFEDSTLIDKFINETETSIEMNMPDSPGNNYKLILPKIKYTGGKPDVSGEGPITLAMPFQAIYDPISQTNIQLDRTAA